MYDFIYVTSGKGKTAHSKKQKNVVLGFVGEGGMNSQSTDGF